MLSFAAINSAYRKVILRWRNPSTNAAEFRQLVAGSPYLVLVDYRGAKSPVRKNSVEDFWWKLPASTGGAGLLVQRKSVRC